MNSDRDEYFERIAEKMQVLEAMGYEGDIIAEATRLVDLEDAVLEVFKKDLYSDGKYRWAHIPAIYGRVRDTHPKLHAKESEIADACERYVDNKILACRDFGNGKKYIFNTYH